MEPDDIVSSESFDKYGLNERCQKSRDRVQSFLDRGLMSQVAVYERYTAELSERLTSLVRSEQPTVVEDIRQSFRRLRDPGTGYLSKALFARLIAEKLSTSGVNGLPDAPALLWNICSLHAFHPFPVSYDSSGQPEIDENGFVRAICLLTLIPVRGYASASPNLLGKGAGTSSGNWGPHRGSYVRTRGKDASDFRRRLFRSLAVRDSTSTSNSASDETKIPVPRFQWFLSDESDQQEVVVEDESELSIDLVDVLSECPPEADRLTANPFRESYRIVLPSLPKRTDDLSTLSIPATDLSTLAQVIQGVQGEGSPDAAAIGGQDGEEKIGWKTFDSALSKQSEPIADGLAKIFRTFWAA